MMKLYSGPLSLFTAKVRIALAEKGLPCERMLPAAVTLGTPPDPERHALMAWMVRIAERPAVARDMAAMSSAAAAA